MSRAAIALVAVVLAIAGIAAGAWITTGLSRENTELLRDELVLIREDLQSLRSRMDRVESRGRRPDVEPASRDRSRRGATSVEADRVAPVTAAAASVDGLASGRPEDAVDLDGLLAELLDGDLPYDRQQELWAEIRDAGLLDQAVAAIKARAEAASGDPDMQVELGNAYLQQLMVAPPGPEKGELATLADEAFAAAIEIDDQHWDARFQKATSLAFWPPIFGKQDQAIAEFEELRSQQESSGIVEDGHAQTYLYLGNLHLQRGDFAKARDVFRSGLDRFPEDDQIRAQLEQAEKSGGE